MIKYFSLIILLIGSFSQAKVFSMEDTRFGGYLNLTYGNSGEAKDYFEGESSAQDYSKGFTKHTGGEFGFVYRSGYLSWLFGMELINSGKVRGTASTGASEKYKYTAEVSAVIPKLGLDFVFYESPVFRFFVSGAVGTASLTSKTDYSSLTIAPNTDFSVEGKGSASFLSYGMGGEWHLNDNTTFSLGLYQRQLVFDKIKYVKAVTGFDGAHAKGDRIENADGSALTYEFSGLYLNLGLRFWLF